MTNKKNIYSLFNRIGLDGITDFTNEFQVYCTSLSNENLFDTLVDFIDSLQDKINVINNKVLDLGCGFGIHSIILSCYNNDVIGIDPAEHRMSEATKLLSFIDENVLKVKFEKSSAKPLPFEDNTFDTVYCNEVVSHVYDLHGTMRECYRVLKPNGRIVVLDCGRNNYLSMKSLYYELPKLYNEFYFNRRKFFLKEAANKYNVNLSDKWLNRMAKKTTGWYKDDLYKMIEMYKDGIKDDKTLLSIYKPKYKYRCPDTGQYEERLWTRQKMAKILRECGFNSKIIKMVKMPHIWHPYRMIKTLIYRLHGYFNMKYIIIGYKEK